MSLYSKLIILLSFLLVSTRMHAQLESPALKEFITYLNTEIPYLQGGAIAIIYKGQVLYKTTFGYQKGKNKPITDNTLFPLASVSKAVTSTAIALMVEKRALNSVVMR